MKINVKRMVPFTVGKIKAFVDITLDKTIVKGFRVVEGKDGDFVGLPSIKGKDGVWYPNFKPGPELGDSINAVIMKAFGDLNPQQNLPLKEETPTDVKVLALAAERSLYSDAVLFFGSTVRYFAGNKVKAYDCMGYRFMKQNPEKINQRTGKLSEWAQKVKDGHKVTWVCSSGSYVARVLDGKFEFC